ncbi:MAG: archease [Candidatus Eisenbacteria bacterium]
MVSERNIGAEGFESVDHTADVGLRVRARSLEALFLHSAEGLAALLAGPRAVGRGRERVFSLRGIDLEELLISWLNEILFCHETERVLFGHFEILHIRRVEDGFELGAKAGAEPYDPARSSGGTEVKAATYHDLRIEARGDGGYEVTIIFDT